MTLREPDMRNVMRDEEMDAKSLMEHAMPGSRMEFHLSQAHGEWDFDLVHPDGRTEPVEVTLSMDRELAEA